MWQPDSKLETLTYAAGGVASSAYALTLPSGVRKAEPGSRPNGLKSYSLIRNC
jgi:hypothetical protein